MAIKNFNYCMYTYLHRKALEYYIRTCDKLGKLEKSELLKRVKIHDMDKLTLYLFWDKKDASKFHRETVSHHIKNDILKKYTIEDFKNSYLNLHLDKFDEKQNVVPLNILIDVLESVFDYECAALTKSDKPLNAYDTCKMLYPELIDFYEIILETLGMCSSYCAITEEAISYINQFDVNEEIIYIEVAKYLVENENNIYAKLGNKVCLECEYNNLLSYYDKYCFNRCKKFFVNYKDLSTFIISKDIINSEDVSFLDLKNKKGKLISFHNKGNYFYFFISIDGCIDGKCFVEKQKLDIDYIKYVKPMLMQLADEEYQCNCGNKFYGKKDRCSYCELPLIY